MGVCLWFLGAEARWQGLLAGVSDLWPGSRTPASDAIARIVQSAITLLLAPAVIAAAAIIAAGLLQTKFLLRPGLLSLQLERLNPFKRLDAGLAVWRPATGLVCLLVLLVISGALAASLFPPAAAMLNSDPADTIWWPYYAVRTVAPFIAAAVAAAAFAAALWARLRFMLVHRMTREEMEKQAAGDDAKVERLP